MIIFISMNYKNYLCFCYPYNAKGDYWTHRIHMIKSHQKVKSILLSNLFVSHTELFNWRTTDEIRFANYCPQVSQLIAAKENEI